MPRANENGKETPCRRPVLATRPPHAQARLVRGADKIGRKIKGGRGSAAFRVPLGSSRGTDGCLDRTERAMLRSSEAGSSCEFAEWLTRAARTRAKSRRGRRICGPIASRSRCARTSSGARCRRASAARAATRPRPATKPPYMMDGRSGRVARGVYRRRHEGSAMAADGGSGNGSNIVVGPTRSFPRLEQTFPTLTDAEIARMRRFGELQILQATASCCSRPASPAPACSSCCPAMSRSPSATASAMSRRSSSRGRGSFSPRSASSPAASRWSTATPRATSRRC